MSMSTSIDREISIHSHEFTHPPKKIPMHAPGMAMPPVNMDAVDLLRLNWVSRYLGRKTMKPDTMISSMQAPRQVTM